MAEPAGSIHRLTLGAILGIPFAIALLRVGVWIGRPWGWLLFWIGAVGLSACLLGLLVGLLETRAWNRRIDPQTHTKRTWRERWRHFLSIDSLHDPSDPVKHQLLRAMSGVVLLASLFLSFAGVVWWWMRDSALTPPSALGPAVIAILLLNVPACVLFAYTQSHYARNPPPLHGPWLPICLNCGYDCRSSPSRCPECGRERTDADLL